MAQVKWRGTCIATLDEIIARHGRPNPFNTDHGSQFTGVASTSTLKDAGIRVYIVARGGGMDNAFIERLWNDLK